MNYILTFYCGLRVTESLIGRIPLDKDWYSLDTYKSLEFKGLSSLYGSHKWTIYTILKVNK